MSCEGALAAAGERQDRDKTGEPDHSAEEPKES